MSGRTLVARVLPVMGLVMVLFSPVRAEIIRLGMQFDPPTIGAAPDGAVLVESRGCVTLNEPGAPLLPARRAVILIPPGHRVEEIRASAPDGQVIPGAHRIAPGQTPRRISDPGPFSPTPPDPDIYGSDAPYPAETARLVTEQIAWGHRLAFVQIYPVSYHPASGTLTWFPQITLELQTAPAPGEDPLRIPNLRRTPEAIDRLSAIIDNVKDLQLYDASRPARAAANLLTPDDYPYVIITSQGMADAYLDLARYESSRGLRAHIVRVDEIAGQYPGRDIPEQLRNFVIDAYQNWNTRFVMLGGDVDVVPVRNLWVDAGGTVDQFPGDCYFEGLDGDWNGDGDALWGEPGEYDLAGEVAVGRMTAHDPAQLATWLHKNKLYAEEPVVSEIEKALFVGERMDDIPTWGCDYMDRVKDYTCDYGYCTSGYPNSYLKEMLCDRDHYWPASELIGLFNEGFPSNHHLGHSNTTYCMKMSNPDLQYFTNNGVDHSFIFMSSQGCYDNNFDANWTDCFGEACVFDDNVAAAFLGNTRYGWYIPGWATGPSQHFDRQIVDARYGEGIGTIGWMNVDSKIDNIWILDPWNLWCHYELCILGDPAMPQWNHMEGALEMVHSGAYVMGQGDYEVTVLASGSPVSDAAVSIYCDDLSVCVYGHTDVQGKVRLNPDPQYPAPLHLKAVKQDYLPAAGSVNVDPGAQPWLVWDETRLDDDAISPSIGDGDGTADLGETIQLNVGLRNIGHVTAGDITATVSCDNPHLTLTDPTAAFGAIDPGAVGFNLDDLLIQVPGPIQDGETAHFELYIASGGGQEWQEAFTFTLHAPVLSLLSWSIDDTAAGDGEGDIDPGESFNIRVQLANAGSDGGRDLAAQLSSDSGYLTMDVGESGCPLVPPGGAADLDPPFQATLDRTAPTESFIHFSLHVTTWCGQIYDAAFDARVDSYFEDLLEADAGWTVGAPGDDATAGLWTRGDPVGTWRYGFPVQAEDDHTPEGTACFFTGQGTPGGQANASDVDGGATTLLSPVIDARFTTEPRLVYWRWYTNNQAQFPGQDYWQVDVSSDGGVTWGSLEYTNQSANEWRRTEFRLEDYIPLTANVRIRFIASDHPYDSLVEAAIDDVSIESLPADPAIVAEAPAVPLRFGIREILPNPAPGPAIIYEITDAGGVSLRIFDIRGGLVRTLVGGTMGPGRSSAIWDGRDDQGRDLPPGVYFCRLTSGNKESVRKLILLAPIRAAYPR